MIEFKAWPKTPRLFRDITVTEKIDGTNAAVQIVPDELGSERDPNVIAYVQSNMDGSLYAVSAQSRKRLITPEDDNAGFARWVADVAPHLVQTLGEGTHFGEWWGQGIQRKYGMDRKVFSLFNTAKWSPIVDEFPDEYGLAVVPTLYQGSFSEVEIHEVMEDLRNFGSVAAPGFMKPEGIVVYHHAANQVFKVLLENDELPKGLVNIGETQ